MHKPRIGITEGFISQYVHIGYITQALHCRIIRIDYVADLSTIAKCVHMHTTGPEHSMSTIEKITVSPYTITM